MNWRLTNTAVASALSFLVFWPLYFLMNFLPDFFPGFPLLMVLPITFSLALVVGFGVTIWLWWAASKKASHS